MKKQLILGLLALTSVGTVKPVSGTFSINDTLLETYVMSWIALPIIGTVLGIYKGIVTMATITCALGTWMALHDIALNINS